MDEKGEMNVKHTTTERFGRVIEKSVERLRLAGIQIDLEALGYEVGCADLCAAGVGAPNIRQRLWWLADANGRQSRYGDVQPSREHGQQQKDGSVVGGLVNAKSGGTMPAKQQGPLSGRQQTSSGNHRLGNASGGKLAGRKGEAARKERQAVAGAGTDNKSPWADYELVHCADGKARRIESGIFPLAHGVPARVGKLRAYGNAIVAPLAAEFIMAYLETKGE